MDLHGTAPAGPGSHTLPVFTARERGQSLRVPNPHYPVLCLRTTPVTARKQE